MEDRGREVHVIVAILPYPGADIVGMASFQVQIDVYKCCDGLSRGDVYAYGLHCLPNAA
jgi:hypothetical protein